MINGDVLKNLVNQKWSERSFAARAQVCDALRQYPRTDDLESLEVAEALGPWRIRSAGEHFEWRLTEQPSMNDRGAWEMSRAMISGDKAGRIRVVLVGESAAGSFGYWESSTLAKQLAQRLQRVDERFEVIDLSCVNASMEVCLGVMKSAVTLDPDYFVLYCANNEGKTLLDNFENGQLNAPTPSASRWSFLTGPLEEFGPSMVAALATHCANQLSRAKRIADHFDVPLLYILPESNSVDWAPQEHNAFALTGQQALHEGRPTSEGRLDAAQACQLQLWQAGKAVGHSDPPRALNLFDAARESGVGAFVNAVPQTVSTVAEALRGVCRSEGIELLDMPALFRNAPAGGWPDRSRFIDYCHLSLEGLHEVSTACAQRVLHMAGVTEADGATWERIDTSAREAFLGAMVGAIHNYHYGQPREIVAYWVAQALGAGWEGAEQFVDVIRTFLLERPREIFTPERLNQNAFFAELPDRYKIFFLKFAYHGRFDRQLLEVLDEQQDKLTLPRLLAARKDDLLAFRGDMYSLFYLDCQRGVRPRLRGSNRTGWERPDLEFLIASPEFEIDIPPTRWVYDSIEIELETDDSCAGTLTCAVDGGAAACLPLRPGRAAYRFAVEPSPDRLRSVRFGVDHLVGVADKHGAAARYRHLGRFGWYPCGGRVVGLRLAAPEHTAERESP